jgi:hypothetical protein
LESAVNDILGRVDVPVKTGTSSRTKEQEDSHPEGLTCLAGRSCSSERSLSPTPLLRRRRRKPVAPVSSNDQNSLPVHVPCTRRSSLPQVEVNFACTNNPNYERADTQLEHSSVSHNTVPPSAVINRENDCAQQRVQSTFPIATPPVRRKSRPREEAPSQPSECVVEGRKRKRPTGVTSGEQATARTPSIICRGGHEDEPSASLTLHDGVVSPSRVTRAKSKGSQSSAAACPISRGTPPRNCRREHPHSIATPSSSIPHTPQLPTEQGRRKNCSPPTNPLPTASGM